MSSRMDEAVRGLASLGHDLVDDEPFDGAERRTCTRCHRAVLIVSSTYPYGSATVAPCDVHAPDGATEAAVSAGRGRRRRSSAAARPGASERAAPNPVEETE